MDKWFSWRNAIIALSIITLFIYIEEIGYFFFLKNHARHHDNADAPKGTNASILTRVEMSVGLASPASTPDPSLEKLEKARASEQFGAALQRAGIETQGEASH